MAQDSTDHFGQIRMSPAFGFAAGQYSMSCVPRLCPPSSRTYLPPCLATIRACRIRRNDSVNSASRAARELPSRAAAANGTARAADSVPGA